MKKIVVLLFTLCTNLTSLYSQISIIGNTLENEESTPTTIVYDSLTNIKPTTNKEGFFKHLIGQTLIYVNTDNINKKDYNLEHEEILDTLYNIKVMQPTDAPKIGTEFTVIDVLTNNEASFIGADIILKENITGNIYKYNPSFDINAVWVVKGFYEKMKELYKGKQFYYIEGATFINKYDEILDFETNEKYNMIKNKSKWTCVDVSIKIRDPKDYGMIRDYRSAVVLVLENEQAHKCYCYLHNRSGLPLTNDYNTNETEGTNLFLGKFLDEDQYKKYNVNLNKRKQLLAPKYGMQNANLILKGIVKIGMTKKMCEESWGRPIKINTTKGNFGIHEQWVYAGQYLYFENGYLTVIQD